MLTLTLPAVNVAARRIPTAHGALLIPGHTLPEKHLTVDPDELARVIQAARTAADAAYAPFSQFKVGAAVVMADDPSGAIYPGSNIENSSYGATVCGERTALFSAAARRFRRLKLLAVSTVATLDRPLHERSPCGICRQVIKEFTTQDIAADTALILIDNGDPDTLCEVFDIERLLPYGFNFAGPDAC